MIAKNIRTNFEFYSCPVYNEAIQDGKKIVIMDTVHMESMGVPNDLEAFIAKRSVVKIGDLPKLEIDGLFVESIYFEGNINKPNLKVWVIDKPSVKSPEEFNAEYQQKFSDGLFTKNALENLHSNSKEIEKRSKDFSMKIGNSIVYGNFTEAMLDPKAWDNDDEDSDPDMYAGVHVSQRWK